MFALTGDCLVPSFSVRIDSPSFMIAFIAHHVHIAGALMMREMTTRFGREGLGMAWIIGEPLVFCLGVLVLWTFTKPANEHGIKLAPFVMTGYMCLILIRHMIGALVNALQANLGLLYHRQVAPVHIFSARVMLEVAGTTAAFMVVYFVLLALRQVSLPHDYLLLYGGWFLIVWMSTGFSLILTGLAMRYETFERVTGLIGYLLIPLSGVFMMVEWLPPNLREIILYVPFVHGVEMVRAGVFSEFVPTHYDAAYALIWGAIFNVLGLALIAGARSRIIVD